MKKALSSGSEGKKAKSANKSKRKWFGKEKPLVPSSSIPETVRVSYPQTVSYPHPVPQLEHVEPTEAEDEPANNAYTVSVDTSSDVEDAVAAEVIQPQTVTQFAGKSEEEVAAIKVQTVFRGYLARRALRALRGLVRLKSLVDGPIVRRQTANTLKCMQSLSRVQSQIQARRLRMLEENRALQRQLLQKRAKELESLRMGEEWDDSLQSKEQIEASLLQKYEATMRRERALAYSYTHQQTWKKSAKSSNLLFMDPTNPHWGWSWLERWMAERPLETQSDLNMDTSAKSANIGTVPGGEITKSFTRHQLNTETPSSPSNKKPPSNSQSPATPSSKAMKSSITARKVKSASPKVSAITQDDDSKSTLSAQSERNRRHSIAGSVVRDDESLASSLSVPSYMASTKSAKAKSKLPSPLGIDNDNTPEKGSAGTVKKLLSYPPSPARPARKSGPTKVDTSSIFVNNVDGGVID
ncbi:protein IQ-DOMAIN 1-like [Dorcoceras hygrometricum]|uniref:Protein IQ-DOMAIN 1-like n=1 Tax=Dorcoceras hygrometricum TaxID=472368 RepID=A0A2Z7CMX5_9LAMI|nr:protein IQ-DOMAIN 1-like [Dorcoceras hygrometricum]